mgnify:FL=1|tara:strand:+ start:3551 stop:3844 length:294 start_codon:yes stop_codon:yes gene_type:complete
MSNNKFLNACGCGSSNASGEVQSGAEDVFDFVRSGATDIFDAVKSTGGFVIDESKEIIDKLEDKGEQLDERPRLLKPVKNSVLVFGGLAILIYALVK